MPDDVGKLPKGEIDAEEMADRMQSGTGQLPRSPAVQRDGDDRPFVRGRRRASECVSFTYIFNLPHCSESVEHAYSLSTGGVRAEPRIKSTEPNRGGLCKPLALVANSSPGKGIPKSIEGSRGLDDRRALVSQSQAHNGHVQ